VIPFYKLTIYKGKSYEYTLYKDQYFVKISTDENVHKFMRKLQQLRIEALQ